MDHISRKVVSIYNLGLFLSLYILLSFTFLAVDAFADEVLTMLDRVNNGDATYQDLSKLVLDYAKDGKQINSKTAGEIKAIPGFGDVVGPSLMDQVLKVLETQSAISSGKLRAFCESILPANSDYGKKINSTFATVERVEFLIEVEDYAKLTKEVEGMDKDAPVRELVIRRYLVGIQKNNQNEFESGNFGKVIISQAGLAALSRSSVDLALIKRSLAGIRDKSNKKAITLKDDWVFDNDLVIDFVTQLAAEDEQVSADLAAIYSTWVLQLLESDRGFEARSYFDKILKLRPDPSDENSALRLAAQSQARGDSAKKFAETLALELEKQGGLSTSKQIQFLLKTKGSSLLTYVFYAILGVVVFFFLLIGIKRIMFATGGLREKWFTQKQSPVMDYSADTQPDYFSRMLTELDLEDGASDGQIKQRYRDLIKEYHPDRARERGIPDEAAREKFRRIKHAYEELQRLRGSSFNK